MKTNKRLEKNWLYPAYLMMGFFVLSSLVSQTLLWWYPLYNAQMQDFSAPFYSFFFSFFNKLNINGIIFPFTLGVALRTYVEPEWDVRSKSLRKASPAFISKFFLSAIFIGAIGSLSQPTHWDVLYFVTVGILLFLFVLRWADIRVLVGMCTICLFAPYIRLGLSFWENSYIKSILFGVALADYHWPFLIWFSTMIIGFLTEQFRYQYHKAIVGIGIAFTCIAVMQIFFIQDPSAIAPIVGGYTEIAFLLWIGVLLLLSHITRLVIEKLPFNQYGVINALSRGFPLILMTQLLIFRTTVLQLSLLFRTDLTLVITIVSQLYLAYMIGLGVIFWEEGRYKKVTQFFSRRLGKFLARKI